MSSTRTAVLKLALTGALTAFLTAGPATVAEAAGVSKKQAMAACRAKYGKEITGVVIKKNGQIVCQEGPSGTPTRKEVYEYCKRKYGATTVIVQKKGNRWHCLYYGRY